MKKEFFVTENGTVFQRDYSIPILGKAWKDPTGMIWGETLPDNMLYDEAIDYAKNNNVSLPTTKDYERLASYFKGSLITFKNEYKQDMDFIKNEWYLASSDYADNRDIAWVFYGDYGYVDVAFRDLTYSVRCVSR